MMTRARFFNKVNFLIVNLYDVRLCKNSGYQGRNQRGAKGAEGPPLAKSKLRKTIKYRKF